MNVLDGVSCKQKTQQKLKILIKNFRSNRILKAQNFLLTKKTAQKQKSETIFPLLYFIMKMKHHTAFILQTFEKHDNLLLI